MSNGATLIEDALPGTVVANSDEQRAVCYADQIRKENRDTINAGTCVSGIICKAKVRHPD
ncbi:hypothetical protein So717_28090 [Roseobacter cerasinus]|uniref:Uncharacterized protein n=1 Tax=Roseobacter cerasinus TaxID=2602289 RepID=A0A640VXW1_9RHOB|nr:hypothetical protein So717_28090 [Roseobacter cerasinus]